MNTKNKVQVNINLPKNWKEILKKKAAHICLNENRDVSYLDLMREAIWKCHISGSVM